MIESWKEVPGFPKYIVSSDGRIARLLKPYKSRSNGADYLVCSMFNGSHKRVGKMRIHRLVLCAFMGTPGIGIEGDHLNGNTQDNRLENLRWTDRSGNMKQSYLNRRKKISKGANHNANG